MLESKAAARPDAARLLDAITRSGYVVIDAEASPAEIAAIDAVIAAHLQRSPDFGRDLTGRRTRRIGGIPPKARALVANRSVLDIAERVLEPNFDRMQLNAAEIAVGETLRLPHRECRCRPAESGNADHAITAVWPLTADNEGPYRIWAGSHDPGAEFVDTPVCPHVPPGSVLLLLGSVLRCANRNRGISPRRQLSVGYASGCLGASENQWLTGLPVKGWDALSRDQAAAASAYLEIQAELEAHDDRPL